MSQTSHLKSAAITNLDATPYVEVTAGEGAKAYLNEIDGYAAPLAADAAGSTYQLVRVRSNVKVKKLSFESQAQGAGKVDIGVYYSTSTIDGTALANQGTAISTTFFSGDIDCSDAVNPTELATEANGYTAVMRNQPLWEALGLASDPGGCFDIVATVHTTAMTTGTGRLNVVCMFA